MFGIRLVNGLVFGISHEGYPEVDGWAIHINIAFLEIILGRNLDLIYGLDDEE